MRSNTRFPEYMQQAWLDTIMPLVDKKDRESARFSRYMLGWPDEKISTGEKTKKYIWQFRFLFPIYKTVKSIPLFVLNVFSETANFLKHVSRDANNGLGYLASLFFSGLQKLLKGAVWAARLPLTPFTVIIAVAYLIDTRVENKRVGSWLKLIGLLLFGGGIVAALAVAPAIGAPLLLLNIFDPVDLLFSPPLDKKYRRHHAQTDVPAGESALVVNNDNDVNFTPGIAQQLGQSAESMPSTDSTLTAPGIHPSPIANTRDTALDESHPCLSTPGNTPQHTL